MIERINDRWVWVGCVVILLQAYKMTQRALRTSHSQTADTSSEVRSNNIEHDSFCINLDTLRILASSPNTNVANAAVSLIVQRVALELRSSNGEFLLTDVRSSCDSVRRRAHSAIEFLRGFNLENMEAIVLPSSEPSRNSRLDRDVSSGMRMQSGARSHGTDIVLPRWRASTSEPGFSGEETALEIRRLRREAMVFRELDD